MPLGRTLAKEDIERIEQWIRDLRPEETVKIQEQEWRWPFQKPLKHELPAAPNAAWFRAGAVRVSKRGRWYHRRLFIFSGG